MKGLNKKREGQKAALAGIIGNIFLTTFNIGIGIISGSYALISEGIHTLSDIITTFIAYFGFWIGQKPADKEHPIGHGRAESISGLIIVLFLALVAYEILTGAIEKIIYSENIVAPTNLAVLMALVGIFVNIAISNYIISIGRNIHSPAIVADGKHQRVDIFASIAILVGLIVSISGYPLLDPIIGLLIGLIVLKTAFDVGKENINNIMGKIPSNDLLEDIVKVAEAQPDVLGCHDVKVDYLGSYAIASLHIELDPELSLKESHEIVHNVQNKIVEEISVIKLVTAHACPYGLEYDHSQEIDKLI